MQLPNEPVRVIYAKLTSTGAYDVVAKTTNIELTTAREIAEKLQLGNPPFGVRIAEELGYAGLAGGHIIVRYTTYGWNDGRPAPPMTDAIWVDDATFDRVRRNPFALVPACDEVFAELTDLPPVVVPVCDEAMEYERVRAIGRNASGFIDFVAGALGGEHVLMVDGQDHRVDLELLLLLLPPPLRDRLTFQTCAYQPPQLARRVTCVDAFHASLRQAAWSLVLPDQSDRLTLKPANRFAEFLAVPERLSRAHELYARLDAADAMPSLATEASRLMRLADFSVVLDRKVATDAIRLVAKASGSEARVALAELEARFDADVIGEALAALLETGADEGALDVFLALTAGTSHVDVYHRSVLDALLRTRREPAAELGATLLRWAAAVADADRVVLLLGAFRRSAFAASVADVRGPHAIVQYIAARASRVRVRPLEAAATVVRAAGDILPLLREAAARQLVIADTTLATGDAIRAAAMSAADVNGLRALQAAVDAAPPELADNVGRLVAGNTWLGSLSPTEGERFGAATGAEAGSEWIGILCTTLIARAVSGEPGLRTAAGAVAFGALDAHEDAQVGRRVATMLDQLGVREGDLLAGAAVQRVLPFLGDFARNASFATRIADATSAVLAAGHASVGTLAELVLAARTDRIDTTRGGRVFNALVNALNDARERGDTNRNPVQAELVLDLLAFAVDPGSFGALETAALGRTTAPVRLRRLDRAILQARTATDEVLYDAIAGALEAEDETLDSNLRRRLRDALGTAGLHRRVMDAFNQALSRSVQ